MKKYDIILFGATGFTGGLVAKYLAQKNQELAFTWAIAGRNINKLQAVKDTLVAIHPQLSTLTLLEADSSDAASLQALTQSTKVIATTVGPYALHGEALVAACVATGTDYVDITGEPAFVQQIIKKYDEDAKKSGSLIINCCGFDSIPADLGAFFTAMQLPSDKPKTIKGYIYSNGTFSGGTWASAVNAFADIFKGSTATGTKSDKKSTVKFPNFHHAKEINKWALPMPVIDPWIVKRSIAAVPHIYGAASYAQYLAIPTLLQAATLTATVGGITMAAQLPIAKKMLLNYRKSGEGPSEQQRAKSFFVATMIGECEGKKVMCKVQGGDPGYTETSKMLSECALLVALHRNDTFIQSGITTPAAALGTALINTLNKQGITFSVVK